MSSSAAPAVIVNEAVAIHHALYTRLKNIHIFSGSFGPLMPILPILGKSAEIKGNENKQWGQEDLPGMRLLREAIKNDSDRLEAFLAKPDNVNLPSTNAPYLISVWNEVISAPIPVLSIFKSFPITDFGAFCHGHLRYKTSRTSTPSVKVDVVCDGGRRWIRVNTVKNSRLLSEFREIDSYLTDSDEDSDTSQKDRRPSLGSKELDNSVLRMGRSLLAAAKDNVVSGTGDTPTITLRLPRLDPSEPNVDPRIVQTVHQLRKMGIDVELGEKESSDSPKGLAASSYANTLKPTTRINLDLSILIALVSDLTHASLPASAMEADTRFIPSQKYRERKKQKLGETGRERENVECSGNDTHIKALTRQMKQEMDQGLLQEIFDRMSAISQSSVALNDTKACKLEDIEFWTTQEARDRCLQIVSKIGGPNERRRANALLSPPASAETSGHDYWQGSRYPRATIPLIPIRIFPTPQPHKLLEQPLEIRDPVALPPFFSSLAQTCRNILAQGTIPQNPVLESRSVENEGDNQPLLQFISEETEPASATKPHPRLTAHTVRSMLWGAELGWTTLTANRSSVKVMIKEMRQVGYDRFDRTQEDSTRKAALWIVEPRSLAEGQRADFDA